MTLVAIASSDGKNIGLLSTSEHFYLYRFEKKGDCQFLEMRTPPGRLPCGHLPLVPQAVALLLADVHVVLASRVDKTTALFLRARGILAFGVQGDLDWALQAYGRRGDLLDTLIAQVRRHTHGPAHDQKES